MTHDLVIGHRAVMASVKLGSWMSAALDDPNTCEAMKADIREWFSAGDECSRLTDRIEALEAENERLQHENQELRSENARLRNDHASAVAELNKTKALLKGYRRGYKTARAALGDTQ